MKIRMLSLLISIMLIGPTSAQTSNIFYKVYFECWKSDNDWVTSYLYDNRINNKITFSKKLGNRQAPVNCKTCNKICVILHPGNPESEFVPAEMAVRLNIIRYRSEPTLTQGSTLNWRMHSSHGPPDEMKPLSHNYHSFCWSNKWPDNYWFVRGGSCEGDNGPFYKTFIEFRDFDGDFHRYQIVPWF